MDWYVVVKTINGRRYFYRQKTYRVGTRVHTVNQYLGPAGEATAEAPSPSPSPLTTTAPASTKALKPQPVFGRKAADRAFDLVMGPKAEGWRHHWNGQRKGSVLVKRNRQIDQLLKSRGVSWSHNTTGCYYSPARDIVNIPPQRCFEDADGQSATAAYYVVVFHEVVHWTKRRVGRKIGIGAAGYAQEELVAELGAVMLMEHFGMDVGCRERHALYFQTWLGRTKDQKSALSYARKEAERAVKWILGHET